MRTEIRALERKALDLEQAAPYNGYFMRQNQRVLRMDPFSYTILCDRILNTPGIDVTPSQGTVDIDISSDFLCTEMTCGRIDMSGGPPPDSAFAMATPPYGLIGQIIELRTGKKIFDIPSSMTLEGGQYCYPFVLPMPRLFTSSSTLQATFFDTNGLNSIPYFTLAGVRIYYA